MNTDPRAMAAELRSHPGPRPIAITYEFAMAIADALECMAAQSPEANERVRIELAARIRTLERERDGLMSALESADDRWGQKLEALQRENERLREALEAAEVSLRAVVMHSVQISMANDAASALAKLRAALTAPSPAAAEREKPSVIQAGLAVDTAGWMDQIRVQPAASAVAAERIELDDGNCRRCGETYDGCCATEWDCCSFCTHTKLRGNLDAAHTLNGNQAETIRQMRDGISRLRAELQAKNQYAERVAQLTAHRACASEEHDPANGKLHGCCVVCLVPWPCEVAR